MTTRPKNLEPAAFPYPRYKIEDGLVKADGLITISPSDRDFYEAPFPRENFGEILMLRFDDIPVESMQSDGKTLKGPTREDLEAAISFSRMVRAKNRQAVIAVNCMAGKSRSPALALAITAFFAKESLGNGHEASIVSHLLAHDPTRQMCFNPKIIDDADKILENARGLHNALGRLCPSYWSWRKYWVKHIG